MKRVLIVLMALPFSAAAQGKAESRELVGHIGSRAAVMVLHGTQHADGGWHLTGEYLVLPTLTRRFVEGERGPELGATSLKEGTTPILFGRDATGELRGTWRGGLFKGTRYGPGGQERERFELSERFPPMEGYSASVACKAGPSTLAYSVENGQVKRFAWRAGGCTLSRLEQRPMEGGLRLEAGRCGVTLREIGDVVRVAAENCAQQCEAEAVLEPVLVDRRGDCRLLRPEAR